MLFKRVCVHRPAWRGLLSLSDLDPVWMGMYAGYRVRYSLLLRYWCSLISAVHLASAFHAATRGRLPCCTERFVARHRRGASTKGKPLGAAALVPRPGCIHGSGRKATECQTFSPFGDRMLDSKGYRDGNLVSPNSDCINPMLDRLAPDNLRVGIEAAQPCIQTGRIAGPAVSIHPPH